MPRVFGIVLVVAEREICIEVKTKSSYPIIRDLAQQPRRLPGHRVQERWREDHQGRNQIWHLGRDRGTWFLALEALVSYSDISDAILAEL